MDELEWCNDQRDMTSQLHDRVSMTWDQSLRERKWNLKLCKKTMHREEYEDQCHWAGWIFSDLCFWRYHFDNILIYKVWTEFLSFIHNSACSIKEFKNFCHGNLMVLEYMNHWKSFKLRRQVLSGEIKLSSCEANLNIRFVWFWWLFT